MDGGVHTRPAALPAHSFTACSDAIVIVAISGKRDGAGQADNTRGASPFHTIAHCASFLSTQLPPSDFNESTSCLTVRPSFAHPHPQVTFPLEVPLSRSIQYAPSPEAPWSSNHQPFAHCTAIKVWPPRVFRNAPFTPLSPCSPNHQASVSGPSAYVPSFLRGFCADDPLPILALLRECGWS